MLCFVHFMHRMFERLGCPMAGRTQKIAKHICFVPLWAAMGWARRSAWSEKCVKHAMFCYILSIGCLSDLGAKWRGEARVLQNIYVLLHFWRHGVGQAERLEREMCKTYYVLLHFMWASRVRAGLPAGWGTGFGYLAF